MIMVVAPYLYMERGEFDSYSGDHLCNISLVRREQHPLEIVGTGSIPVYCKFKQRNDKNSCAAVV